MIAKPTIFREYDIRGVVGKDFDAELARELGRAYGSVAQRTGVYEATPPANRKIGVGCDCRLSSEELKAALIAGLRDAGLDVIDGGMGPTPQLYYLVASKNLMGGIQVTGSHNPGDQNGFKMMLGGRTLSGADIQLLRKTVEQQDYQTASGAKQGALETFATRPAYIEELVTRSQSHMGKRKLRVVVDGGNGVGGLVGPEMLRRLGCEVIELYTEPDGRFPNHHPDPTVLENIVELRRRVVQEKADVGIAWDGDADRIGVVDEKGDPIFGDMLLVIFGRQMLKEVQKPIVIGDVKCSELLFSDLKEKGAETIMAKTGHSLIKAKLKELHAHLAGEMSGHIFFVHRWYGFDDALHSSARFVEILSNSSGPVSALLSGLPKLVSTPEIRLDCAEEIKFKVAETAKTLFPEYKTNDLDGVRVTFANGWGLVRASNTQPVLVMRFEADTPARLEEYQQIVESRIHKLQADLGRG